MLEYSTSDGGDLIGDILVCNFCVPIEILLFSSTS